MSSIVALVAELSPGSNRIDFDVTVPNPVLWWPCSHVKLGGHALYSMKADAVLEGVLSDSRIEKFGMRTAPLTVTRGFSMLTVDRCSSRHPIIFLASTLQA